MNEIRLNRRELVEILETFDRLYSADHATKSVHIQQDNSSGIGSITQASWHINHQGIWGTFITSVSTEKDW